MASTSKIGIKKEALRNNIQFVKSFLDDKTKLSVVIKGNAYGHGIKAIVPVLEDLGINHFCTYSSSEAICALGAKSKKSVLMIMGFIYPKDYEIVIKNDIEFYVSDIETLDFAIKTAKKIKKAAIIHIDVETGMNRTGLTIKDLKKIIPILHANKEYLIIKGLTSHFAGAESIANYYRIKKQFSVFKKRDKLLSNAGIHPEIKHIASSAATINYPETKLDMVRSGILIYGYWPTNETFIKYIHRRKDKTNPLERALFWQSEVVITKIVPEGEFIGYGLSFQAQHKMKIMVIPVGYCNGYSRSLGNNGYVLVNGQRAVIIGTVNMNMLICDITNIDSVKVGNEVILIGKQKTNEISFSSFAEMNNSLNYEILARLPENIERIID